jgi:hypothetical protein
MRLFTTTCGTKQQTNLDDDSVLNCIVFVLLFKINSLYQQGVELKHYSHYRHFTSVSNIITPDCVRRQGQLRQGTHDISLNVLYYK